MRQHYLFYLLVLFLAQPVFGQDISLFQQFNGRYDYVAIGNTMNTEENGPVTACNILTSSSATLNLNANQTIQAAYLYWAGSGAGDFDINLNANPISAERTFSDALDANRQFFAAFADVTSFVIAQGNGDYTLSDLDLTTVIPPYCPTGTNFAGWAITIIYEDEDLPLNQINVYDGLQSVPTELTITLDNLNVLDNEGAKIGFIAWEGDDALSVNEQLTVNGNVIGNPPLNPANNAFNGTNSFTGETDLYNMDIDFYSVQNNIDIGDTSAIIRLTSGQDFVMINNVITVLNSQLPDATITIDEINVECDSRSILVYYTVSNINSTDLLPTGTPIAFYAESTLVGQSSTQADLPIGESESGTIVLDIPDTIPDNFNLLVVVDDNGTGDSTIVETNENNNVASNMVTILTIPPILSLPNLIECDEGFNMTGFDLTEQYDNISSDPQNISFHLTEEDARSGNNAIGIPDNFTNTSNPQHIFVRVTNTICFETATFLIEVENCPPFVPQGISPNGDGANDDFHILGLRDIFENYELLIYNRYGTLIYKGNNAIPNWDGTANKGVNNRGERLPTGTYFYVLHLNDPNYKALSGWVYLNR